MVDYYGKIASSKDIPPQGTRGCLAINSLFSLMTDMADFTNDDNFHVILNPTLKSLDTF